MKLKAFTILELIVVMILTSILTGGVYLAFQLVNQYMHVQTEQREDSLTMTNFNYLMTHDFDQSDIIERTDQMLYFTSSKINLQYDFYPNFIIRQSIKPYANPDTFLLSSQAWATQREGHDIVEGVIDHLSVDLIFFEKERRWHWTKTYTANEKLKQAAHGF